MDPSIAILGDRRGSILEGSASRARNPGAEALRARLSAIDPGSLKGVRCGVSAIAGRLGASCHVEASYCRRASARCSSSSFLASPSAGRPIPKSTMETLRGRPAATHRSQSSPSRMMTKGGTRSAS